MAIDDQPPNLKEEAIQSWSYKQGLLKKKKRTQEQQHGSLYTYVSVERTQERIHPAEKGTAHIWEGNLQSLARNYLFLPVLYLFTTYNT